MVEQPLCAPYWFRSKHEVFGVRNIHELGQAPGLSLGDSQAKVGQFVIAAAFVVQIGIGPYARFLDQPIAEHALDRAVERARSHASLALGSRGNLLHNAVAMALTVDEGQQDVEDRRSQGKEGFRVSSNIFHYAS